MENIQAKVQFTTSPPVPSRGQVCSIWLSNFPPAGEEIDGPNKGLLKGEKCA